MVDYLKKQFSEFRENQRVVKVGLNLLMDEVKEKLLHGAIFNITFIRDNIIHTFNWRISSTPLKFHPIDNLIKDKYIEEFILSLLRDNNMLTIVFRNDTGQMYKGKSICELWGYRLVILDNVCSLQYITEEEMFRYNTTDSNGKKMPPDESTIYCGPEGKIFGWERI